MKKLVVFLLVCSLVMVVAGAALATPRLKLDEATTKVYAWVYPYAHVCWIGADTLNFSGKAYDTEYGKATYFVESNCPIIAKTEGGDFTYAFGRFKLETDYGNYFGYYPYEAGQEFTSLETHFMGKKIENVYYKAKTGDISDQPAGLYATYLTTTVYTNF